jgi:hypothetical protein
LKPASLPTSKQVRAGAGQQGRRTSIRNEWNCLIAVASVRLRAMHAIDRLGIFERLRHSIQLLACPAEVQLSQLPSFACKADELALDFDQWCLVVVCNFRSELTASQLSCLDAIRERLSELTHMGSEHWSDDAVRQSTEWQGLRTLATAALASFSWQLETPPSYADEYVGRGSQGRDGGSS